MVENAAAGAMTWVTETLVTPGWPVLSVTVEDEMSVTVTVTVVTDAAPPAVLDEIPIQKTETAEAEIMATMTTAAAGALIARLRPERRNGLTKVACGRPDKR